jgi:N-acetylneuraminate synthase
MPNLEIAGRSIGVDCPVFIVAELSANHHGRIDEAVELVHAAARCGADAVKLQTYTADTLTLDVDRPWFRIAGDSPWRGQKLHELYQSAATPWEWYPQLAEVARRLGLALFSTPFDPSAVDFLERQQAPAYKIASFELVDLPLIRLVAAIGKPVILSTGMATREEIADAVRIARSTGNEQIALLKCVSSYPAAPAEMNLRAIRALADEFGVLVGLSDHSLTPLMACAAVALGACIIEKHLTLSRTDGGTDSAFSLEPNEFRELVDAVRLVESSLGTGELTPSASEAACRELRRSLFAVADIRAGEPLTADKVRSIRPAAGIPPKHLDELIGRRAKCDIARGTPLAWELIE